MTPLSRRALITAATAVVLAGCGGPGGEGHPNEADAAGPRGRPSQPEPGDAHASAPDRLRIPAIGVDTPVMRLGLAANGAVQVPPIAADSPAGWYKHSPAPGQLGPSVILGHVTVGDYGDGVFRDLKRLRPDDRIETRLENGEVTEFVVTDLQTVAKADFPEDAVYGNVDRPELRLITCGGERLDDEYLSNVIAYAHVI